MDLTLLVDAVHALLEVARVRGEVGEAAAGAVEDIEVSFSYGGQTAHTKPHTPQIAVGVHVADGFDLQSARHGGRRP